MAEHSQFDRQHFYGILFGDFLRAIERVAGHGGREVLKALGSDEVRSGSPSAAEVATVRSRPVQRLIVNLLPLLSVAPKPQIFALVATNETASDVLSATSKAGLVVRVLRGRKMRSWQCLFDEVAAALQFPWYFGENADALSDCLTDLEWLPRQGGYVIVIDEPDDVLADAEPDALSRLVALLRNAEKQWALPIKQDEWWDRPAVPFHVVLHTNVGTKGAHRWTAAGGDVLPLPS